MNQKRTSPNLGCAARGSPVLRKTSVAEELAAVRQYQRKHGDALFNGITIAALAERFAPAEVIHIRAKGFFVKRQTEPESPCH
jgi:hypothetical protein